MSIKYAVLGLLAECPQHGYAIHTAFEQRLSDFWELNYGQVYQVLTQLERRDLIAGCDEQNGRRPQRKVYAVTAKGRAVLQAWLARPVGRRRPFRDDFYVRLLFVDRADQERLSAVLDAELATSRERLATLVDRRDRMESQNGQWIVSHLFARAAVLHAEADLEALRQCRAILTPNAVAVSPSRAPAKTRPASRPASRA